MEEKFLTFGRWGSLHPRRQRQYNCPKRQQPLTHSPNDIVSHSRKAWVIDLQSLRLSTCMVPLKEGTCSRNMLQTAHIKWKQEKRNWQYFYSRYYFRNIPYKQTCVRWEIFIVVTIVFRIKAFIMWQVMRFRTQDTTCNYKQTKQSLQHFMQQKTNCTSVFSFHIP